MAVNSTVDATVVLKGAGTFHGRIQAWALGQQATPFFNYYPNGWNWNLLGHDADWAGLFKFIPQ